MKYIGLAWRVLWVVPMILCILLLGLVALIGYGPMFALKTIDAVID